MRFVLIVVLVALLSACSSSGPTYQSANSPDSRGYHDSKLAEGRYRVSYNGSRTDSANDVKDLALLRAAELTMVMDYDWFRIVDRQTVNNTDERPSATVSVRQSNRVSRSCGLLGCTTTVEPGYTGLGVASTQRGDRYETTLEIVLGKGQVDDPSSIYNARELYKNLKATYSN